MTDYLKQPDFRALYYWYFAKAKRPLKYEVRRNSNRVHDLHFLSSAIHDARFIPSKILFNKKMMKIKLKRETWELFENPYIKDLDCLKVVPSIFTVNPVFSYSWTITQEKNNFFKQEHEIQEIKLLSPDKIRDDDEDIRTLRVRGFDWNLDLQVDACELAIKIQDSFKPLFTLKDEFKNR
jgi:hypothetical protein